METYEPDRFFENGLAFLFYFGLFAFSSNDFKIPDSDNTQCVGRGNNAIMLNTRSRHI